MEEKQISGIKNENKIGGTAYKIGNAIAKEAFTLQELNERGQIGKHYTWTNSNKSTLVIDMGSEFLGDYDACAEISGRDGNLRIIVGERTWPDKMKSRLVFEVENGEVKISEPGNWMFYFVEQAEKIQKDERVRINTERIAQGEEQLNEIRKYLNVLAQALDPLKRN